MSFDDLQKKRIEKSMNALLLKRRPPVEIRSKVDLTYIIEKLSVIIFEIRPQWDNPGKKIEIPISKATYVKSKNIWKLYWQRSDLKWHLYEPYPEAESFDEFLEIVDYDEFACFWG